MRATWSQRLTADEREDGAGKMVMKQRNETRSPGGDSDRLSGLVLLSDHAGPHVHSSPRRRRVGGCSGSAMGRDHVWADNSFMPNYPSGFWCGCRANLEINSFHQGLARLPVTPNHCSARMGKVSSAEFGIFQSTLIKPFSAVSAQRPLWVAHATSFCVRLCFCSTVYHFKRPSGKSADNRPL